MSHWNYRVIEYDEKFIGVTCGIHEVYYEDDGSIYTWSARACGIQGDSLEELSMEADRMMQAITLPVLKLSELEDMEVKHEQQDERMDGAGR